MLEEIITIHTNVNGSIKAKSKKEHPQINEMDVLYIKRIAQGQIEYDGFDIKKITVATNMLVLPKLYWMTLQKLKPLLNQIEAAYKAKHGHYLWQTSKPVKVKSKHAMLTPVSDPEAIEPEAVEPEAIEPEAVEPEAVEPEAVEPEAIEVVTLEEELQEVLAVREPLRLVTSPNSKFNDEDLLNDF